MTDPPCNGTDGATCLAATQPTITVRDPDGKVGYSTEARFRVYLEPKGYTRLKQPCAGQHGCDHGLGVCGATK